MEKQKLFLELGSSNSPELLYLLKYDWHSKWCNYLSSGHFDVCMPKHFLCKISKHTVWRGIFVEPHPSHIIKLTDIMAYYDTNQYSIYQLAVSGNTRIRKFVSSSDKDLSETDYGAHIESIAQDKHGIMVQAYSLDDIIGLQEDVPYFIRLDIEGMEYEAIESYSFNNKPNVWSIELHKCDDYNKSKQSLISKFQKHGYTVAMTKDSGWIDKNGEQLDVILANI